MYVSKWGRETERKKCEDRSWTGDVTPTQHTFDVMQFMHSMKNDTVACMHMYARVGAYSDVCFSIQDSNKKNNFFWSFDASSYCHYGTQTRTIITPLLLLSLLSENSRWSVKIPRQREITTNWLSTGSGSIMGLKTGENALWLQHSLKSTHSCRV